MMKFNCCQQGIVLGTLAVVMQILPSLSFAAENGVVILQREVPPRTAYREAAPSRTSIVDVSPDDKVQHMVNERHMTRELQDADFAGVSSGHALSGSTLTILHGTTGLAEAHSNNRGLSSLPGMSSSTAQSTVPIVTGAVGPAVNAATGQIGAGMKSMSGVLNGLNGSIMRTGAQ